MAGSGARRFGSALGTCSMVKGVWFQSDAPPSRMKRAIYALQSRNSRRDGEDTSPKCLTYKATTMQQKWRRPDSDQQDTKWLYYYSGRS